MTGMIVFDAIKAMIKESKKESKYIMTAVLLSGAFLVPLAVPAVVSAEQNTIQTGVCGGATLALEANACEADQGTEQLNKIITTVINVVSLVVGIVAVVMIIVGGLKYITSGGESSNVSSAKNTIIYAIIGLIVVALAQFIVQFVLGRATDV